MRQNYIDFRGTLPTKIWLDGLLTLAIASGVEEELCVQLNRFVSSAEGDESLS